MEEPSSPGAAHQDRQAQGPRYLNMHAATAKANSTTSSPLSSAPPTPRLETPQRPSHPATSPMQAPNAHSPRDLRRTSSAMNLSHSSPKLARRTSRQSLGSNGGAIPEDEQEKRPTPKRSISNLVIANLREAGQTTMSPIPEPPAPLIAAQIAAEYFTRELQSHNDPGGAGAETVVILHDACYGHRYSRLKATKSALAQIVERPERLNACVLGTAAAYVRLGGLYAGGRNGGNLGRIAGDMAGNTNGNSGVPAQLPPFKIRRTARSLDITGACVTAVHGTAWMSELQTMCHTAGSNLAQGTSELTRPSTPTTEPSNNRELHAGDLYLSPQSLSAFEGALGGVADAVDAIFAAPHGQTQTKRAFVAVRPPGHHCSADYPSGFCWVNNVHVGIEYAAQTHGLTHAAILDFDLHHGDGSQAIAWERNKKRLNAKSHSKMSRPGPAIGYYSLHDINSYPCEMGDDEKVQAASLCVEGAHGQSVWNVHLQAWKTLAEFWALYEEKYRILLEKARSFLRQRTARLEREGKGVQPKAAIFISAGFDASEHEGAGMQRHAVNVPTEFYARFTRDVVQLAQEEGSGCSGRVISVLEGGYSDRALCSGVLSHLSGLCGTPASNDNTSRPATSSAAPLDEMLTSLRLNGTSNSNNHNLNYDPAWWSPANLTRLETHLHPPSSAPGPPLQGGRRVRVGPQPTYATPTESFAYKVNNPEKFARSISGTMREVPTAPASLARRAPTPPPVEVDWVVAVHELSKLLIPVGPGSRSCTAEELGGVRVKRERQSVAPAMTAEEGAVGGPRQLRERRPAKLPARYAESTLSDEVASQRSVSAASGRRVTMHELPSLSSLGDGEAAAPPVPALPPTNNGGMGPPAVPMPERAGGGGGMPVKKTRAPPPTKPLLRKTPSVSASAPASPAMSTSTTQSGAPLAPARSNVDVDALTSGMKKITLKVGSREAHDKKVREREAAEAAERRARALKGAETRRVNAAAKRARESMAASGVTAAAGPVVLPQYAGGDGGEAGHRGVSPVRGAAAEAVPAATVGGQQQQEFAGAQPGPLEPPMLVGEVSASALQASNRHPVGEPLTEAKEEATAPRPTVSDSAARPSLQQENDRAVNSTAPGVQRLQSHPDGSGDAPLTTQRSPGNNTLSSQQKKKPLPVWSSTGVIPFAAAAQPSLSPTTSSTATGGAPGLAKRTSTSGLRSPRTPSTSSGLRSPRSPSFGGRVGSVGDGNGVSKSMLGNLLAEEDGQEKESVWDVPETPRQL